MLKIISSMIRVACALPCMAAEEAEYLSKIALLVDFSKSFYTQDVNDSVKEVIDKISNKKVHRWEAGKNIVGVISIDALPELLWSGSIRELRALEPGFWEARFNARGDYSYCTDLISATNLAVEFLSGDPRYVQKTLYLWSDFVSEIPGSSVYRPKTYSKLPPKDFPCQELRDINTVTALMVPPNQKLAWLRAADGHGLTNFTIYTRQPSLR